VDDDDCRLWLSSLMHEAVSTLQGLAAYGKRADWWPVYRLKPVEKAAINFEHFTTLKCGRVK
jgi:hypothetical protein